MLDAQSISLSVNILTVSYSRGRVFSTLISPLVVMLTHACQGGLSTTINHHRNNSPGAIAFMTNERSKSHAYHDLDYESQVQAALTGYREWKSRYPSVRYEDVSDMLYLNYWDSTIMFRSHTQHLLTSRKEHTSQTRRLLPHDAPSLSSMRKSYLEQSATSEMPIDHCAVQDHASDPTNCCLGKNWSYRLVTRNLQLVTAKPSKLDTKRPNNFNEAVVLDFFYKLEHIYNEYGDIPPEHIYNMDEKGTQQGGGRKNNGQAYMYFWDQRNHRHKISSDNLELVIVIECISAAGASTPPAFILSDGPIPNLSKLPVDSISR